MISAGTTPTNRPSQLPAIFDQLPDPAYVRGPQWKWPMAPGPTFNITGKATDPALKEYLDSQRFWQPLQQTVGMSLSAGLNVMDTYYAGQAANNQYKLGSQKLDIVQSIYDGKLKVAMRDRELIQRGQDLQEKGHQRQIEHEQTLAELAAKTQRRLKLIDVEGQNKRAGMMAAVIPAFNRNGYFDGSPFRT